MRSLRHGSRALCVVVALAGGCKDKADNSGDATQPAASPSADDAPEPSKPAKEKKEAADEPPRAEGGVADADADPPALAPATKLTADVASLVDALGDRSLVTFVLRPSKWTTTAPALKTLLSAVPEPEFQEISAAPTFAAALQRFAQMMGLDKTVGLEGIDEAKPVVGALFDAPAPDVDPDPAAFFDLSHSRGVRHAILVPVTDGAAFVDSLAKMLHARALPNWIDGEGPALTTRVTAVGYVVVGIEGGYARVTIFEATDDVPAEQAKARLLSRIRPKANPPARTPALRELIDNESIFAVNVRPWRIRDAASSMGRHEMSRAIASAAPEYRATMLARGLSIVMNAELFLSEATPEFDDSTYVLGTSAEGDFSIASVASLTPHGRRLWDAGRTDVAAVPVKAGRPVAEGFVRVDLTALLDAAQPHPVLDHARPGEAAQLFQQCGWACQVYAPLAAPVQTIDTIVGAASPPGGVPPLLGLSYIVANLDPPKAAIAAATESPAKAAALRSQLESWKLDELLEVEIGEASRGSEGLLLASVGLTANKAFEIGSHPSDALLYGVGRAALPDLPKSMTSMVTAMQVDRRGPALVTQLSIADGHAPKLDYAPDFAGVTWDSPILAYPGADKSDCVFRATRAGIDAFSAVATVAPEARRAVIDKAVAEAKDAFDCPDGSPGAKARAKHIERLIKAVIAAVGK